MGSDRASAISHMSRALDAFYIEGIQHNISFLSALMRHPRWRSGDLSTGFIAEEYPGGFSGGELTDDLRAIMVTVAAVLDHTENTRRRSITDQMGGKPVRFAVERVVRLGEDIHAVEIVEDGGPLVRVVHKGGSDFAVQGDWVPGDPVWTGQVNGRTVNVQVSRILNGYRISHGGVPRDAYVFTGREAELDALMPAVELADTSKFLLCPMPGLVVSIAVKEGQEIKAGESLCVVEAMKMENVLRAERDSTVEAIKCAPGDSLAVDEVIMEFS